MHWDIFFLKVTVYISFPHKDIKTNNLFNDCKSSNLKLYELS